VLRRTPACWPEVRGRSRKLRINYRTTEETRRFATAVLQGEAIDDLDGGEDNSGGHQSLMHGQAPVVQGFGSQREELDWMAQGIQRMRERREALQDICVVARTNAPVDAYHAGLQERGFPCVRLSRKLAHNGSQEGVRLATMHRVKALEFRRIMLVGANDGVLPVRTERALFHVAATCAINRLFVSWFGSPSPFLASGGS
jgi:superfamily I DNA/RNA helicase